jgi:hypothetical protein
VHESVASGPRHSDWPTWLEDYGRFLRETARNRTTAAHCVSAYALGNRLRRILDELSPEDTPEEAARRVGERQAILDTLLADCSDRLLATTLDALPADGHGRRTAILRLSRHMAAIDRCLWFFAMHCSESAIFESMFLFPLIEGCRRRPLGFQ